MLKAIWFGIKDYINDIQHDKLLRKAERFNCKVKDKIIRFNKKKMYTDYIDAVTWKEGNVWHYIRQYIYTKRNSK